MDMIQEKVFPYIYFDMDGVITKWDTNASLEDTFENGFFLHCAPDKKMVDLIQKLDSYFHENIRILSFVYPNKYAKIEKKEWLEKNGLGNIIVDFPLYGNQMEVYQDTEKTSILIDDFTPNLKRWQTVDEHLGIKYLNGINGNYGTWNGMCLSYEDSIDRLLDALMDTAFALGLGELDIEMPEKSDIEKDVPVMDDIEMSDDTASQTVARSLPPTPPIHKTDDE